MKPAKVSATSENTMRNERMAAATYLPGAPCSAKRERHEISVNWSVTLLDKRDSRGCQTTHHDQVYVFVDTGIRFLSHG